MPSKAAFDAMASARFGMFIHWGLYSLLGGRWQGQSMDYIGEWVQSHFRIPNREYHALASQFNPTGFNAEQWVSTAYRAGMRYLVFTAKHHDGFAMYDSQVSDFCITRATPWKRDPLAELAAACEKYQVALGIYYSQDLDWDAPDGGDPGPDFPLNKGMSWGNDWDFPDYSTKKYSRCFESKILPQVKELLTNYGKIATMWFDCPTSISSVQSRTLADLVHQYQPECLINNRIGNGCGDFDGLGDNQLLNKFCKQPIESCITMNDTWGFKYDDQNWKDSHDIIDILLNCAEKNGNLLLNVGPDGQGCFPRPALKILSEIEDWYRKNGSHIHGNTFSPFIQGLPDAYALSGGNELYLYPKKPLKTISLAGIISPLASASVPVRQQEKQNIPVLKLDLEQQSTENFPEIKLKFAEFPIRVLPMIFPQGDKLLLMPATARIVNSLSLDGQTDNPEQQPQVGAEGKFLVNGQNPWLELDGTLANWLVPGAEIQWQIALGAGVWDITLITRQRLHGEKWLGGYTLRLSFEDQQFDHLITASDIHDKKCYPCASSPAGQFKLSNWTYGTFSLKYSGENLPELQAMSLVQVIFRQI